MSGILDSLADGCRDAFDGCVNEQRRENELAYAGGVKIGECKLRQFMESTVDHTAGNVAPQLPMELWEPLIPLLAADCKNADVFLEQGEANLLPLELLSGDDVFSSPDRSLLLDQDFFLYERGLLSELEPEHLALMR